MKDAWLKSKEKAVSELKGTPFASQQGETSNAPANSAGDQMLSGIETTAKKSANITYRGGKKLAQTTARKVKEKREISARFIEPKEFINFSLSHKEQLSHYNMKALEHCKVWRLPKRDLQRLYDLSINFNKLARLHLEKSINHKIKREEDFHKLNAEERYKKLMANERWMFRSIPLKDIASYIGITPQALSNIRKRI